MKLTVRQRPFTPMVYAGMEQIDVNRTITAWSKAFETNPDEPRIEIRVEDEGDLAPVLTASALRDLAQYLLSASVQLQRGILDPEVANLLTEWTKANAYVMRRTWEFSGSVAARATKAAIGMLTHHQQARDVAATECTALLEQDEALRDALADARWEAAGFQIAGVCIAQYLGELQRGQK